MAVRGRKPIKLDATELQNVISQVETVAGGAFASRGPLWEAVSATEWAKNREPRPLSPQVAMLFAEKNNLVISTPKGMRGRQKGCSPVPGGGRKKKSLPDDVMTALYNAVPKNLHNLVEKAKGGSAKAAIKLKCLDCVAYIKKEVSLCEMKDCSLWSLRPYKNGIEDKKVIIEVSRRSPIPLTELGAMLL